MIAKLGSTILALALLAGCNTVQGAGQDIENAGEGLQETSQEVESSM
jgi:predicted small secreted protein